MCVCVFELVCGFACLGPLFIDFVLLAGALPQPIEVWFMNAHMLANC